MPDSQTDRSGDEERTPLGVLREVFGFDTFRGQQLAIMEHVVAGGDAVVLMPTGGGNRSAIRCRRYCAPASA